MTEQRRTADTITDDALDALYEELGTFKAQLLIEQQRVTRIRALHQRWDASPGHCAHCITGPGNLVPWPCPTIQALDTPEP